MHVLTTLRLIIYRLLKCVCCFGEVSATGKAKSFLKFNFTILTQFWMHCLFQLSCSYNLATLTATLLRIEHFFSILSRRAVLAHLHWVSAHLQWVSVLSQWSRHRTKIFHPFRNFSIRNAASVESHWSLYEFAMNLSAFTKTALRTHWNCRDTLANARRQRCRSFIEFNVNDIVDCFVIIFNLQNNDQWSKDNGKITYSVNVSY